MVGQVVAVDRGDHRVAQAHPGDRARDPRRLERVVPGRLAGLDVAEAAAAGAGVAEDHEGRRAALPALADVGARRLLADRVQVLAVDQLGQLAVARPAGRRHLEPGRLACARIDRLGPRARCARPSHRALSVSVVVAAIAATYLRGRGDGRLEPRARDRPARRPSAPASS